jgi:hypothetical protein
MKKLLYLLAILLAKIATPIHTQEDECSLVFVHLGSSEIPSYAVTAVEQARLFNPNCPFYFIVQQAQVKPLSTRLKHYHVTCVAAESLRKTPHHIRFLQTSTLDPHWHNGFWKHTTERFFYLEEFIKDNNLTAVFHIENDIMLYANLQSLLPVFQKHYKGIGVTFPSDHQCVPGFVYIPSAENLQPINQFLADHACEGKDDGLTLSKCKNTIGREYIDYLPVICPEYMQYYEMKNSFGEKPIDPTLFSQHIEEFQSLFDAAAFGQYLGGWSPLNHGWDNGKRPKNFWSMFDAEHVPIVWERDGLNRKIPYATFAGKKYRINNLHIHSKNLKGFCS